MKLRIVGWLPIVLALGSVAPLAAQYGLPPIAIEGRGGLSLPTGDFARQLTLGYGLGGHASLAVTPSLGLYAGYTYTSFDFDSKSAGQPEGSYNVQGVDGGLLFNAPTLSRTAPYLRLGGVYYNGESSNGLLEDDAKFGYQLGAGFDYQLGLHASLTPELRYTTISRSSQIDITYVTLDVGLKFRL
jgi:opacity protein-like surface antigen